MGKFSFQDHHGKISIQDHHGKISIQDHHGKKVRTGRVLSVPFSDGDLEFGNNSLDRQFFLLSGLKMFQV